MGRANPDQPRGGLGDKRSASNAVYPSSAIRREARRLGRCQAGGGGGGWDAGGRGEGGGTLSLPTRHDPWGGPPPWGVAPTVADDRPCLLHIRDAIDRIRSYTHQGKEAFFTSSLLQ